MPGAKSTRDCKGTSCGVARLLSLLRKETNSVERSPVEDLFTRRKSRNDASCWIRGKSVAKLNGSNKTVVVREFLVRYSRNNDRES